MGNLREKRGKLFFDFRYRGVRCCEYTKLPDTAANRKRMQKVLDKIEQAIVTGTFKYADFFPGSTLVERFADKGVSPVVSRALPMEAMRAPGTPLFRTFIEAWYALSLPSWRKSHAATVRSTIDCHLVSCSTPFQTVNPLIPRSWMSLGRSGGFFFTSRTVARATSPFLQGREPGEVT